MNKDLPDYTEQVQLYAWNGTELIPVLVDSNGNIVAVIKGDYSGILKTIAIDDKGYMLIKQLPILTVDRKGEVIFYDNFSNGIGIWSGTGSGTGGKAAIATEAFKTAGFSLKMATGVNGVSYGYLTGEIFYLKPSNMGIECNISFNNYVDYITIALHLYTKTQVYTLLIKINITEAKIQLSEDTVNWIDIPTSISLVANIRIFHSLKVVADFINGKYIRLIFDGTSYNISDYSLHSTTDDYYKRTQVNIQTASTSTLSGDTYLDSLVITQNEP
ncbi:hypothetical protein ES705_32800 [subsurface metagenome]